MTLRAIIWVGGPYLLAESAKRQPGKKGGGNKLQTIRRSDSKPLCRLSHIRDLLRAWEGGSLAHRLCPSCRWARERSRLLRTGLGPKYATIG